MNSNKYLRFVPYTNFAGRPVRTARQSVRSTHLCLRRSAQSVLDLYGRHAIKCAFFNFGGQRFLARSLDRIFLCIKRRTSSLTLDELDESSSRSDATIRRQFPLGRRLLGRQNGVTGTGTPPRGVQG